MLQMIWISRRCIRPYAGFTHMSRTQKFNRRARWLPLLRMQSADARARRNLHSSIQAQPTAPRLRVPQVHRSLPCVTSILQARTKNAGLQRWACTPLYTCAEVHAPVGLPCMTHVQCVIWHIAACAHALMHAEVVNGYTLTWLMWSGPSSIWPARMQVSPLVSYSNDTVHNSVHHQFPSNATYDSISTMPSW